MSKFKKTVSRNYYPLHISGELHVLRAGILINDFFWRPSSFLVVRYGSKLYSCFEDSSPQATLTNFEALFAGSSYLIQIFSDIARDLERSLSTEPGTTKEDAVRLYERFKANMAKMLMGSRIAFRMRQILSTKYAFTDSEYSALFRPHTATLLPRELEALRKAQKNILAGGNIRSEAEKLAADYGWIHSEYRGRAWGTEDYVAELQRKSVYAEPENIQAPEVTNDIRTIAQLLGYIHDEGKSAVVRSNWALRETIKAIGEDEMLVLASTEEEFLAWARGDSPLPEENKLRIDGDMAVLLEDASITHFFGTDAVAKLVSDFDLSSSFKNLPPEGNLVIGTPAFRGKVKGKVKIVFDYKDSDSLHEGDILVASMTTPELIAAMHKAAAFVTDEGGITCHAAIVAREMKKPCVIGTKNATKVLKDGDMVEVDAEKGMVRILERVKVS